ncbi:hypothetical protein [Bradyrhizobium prioriisuperbiae]|uniref:hypothetical protein n=1 Tax=Bradyrhizobium prioriisuperbiae TaxID=2854389 RepID=UPI0028E234E4|nr:hypothetical protein [Bradyrhizobium prioritasuperba]
MLADPNRSRVLLINPDRCVAGNRDDCLPGWRESASLLPVLQSMFAMSPILIGERDATLGITDVSESGYVVLDVDPLVMWRSSELPPVQLDAAAALFFGGAWLEEDVLIAAIRAASDGYDVRILTDMSRCRREADRQLVTDRATMHGILMVTLRQALLEWAAYSDDRKTIAQVRALLT